MIRKKEGPIIKTVCNHFKNFQGVYHPPNRKSNSVFEDLDNPPDKRELRYRQGIRVKKKINYILTGRR